MTELTPEQVIAQDEALGSLKTIRREGESFFSRRNDAIIRADALGLSYREIAQAIGMSHQGVGNIIKQFRAAQREEQ